MKISDEMLSAFVNGTLAAPERQQVELAIASDQTIARRVARYARRSRVRAALDDMLHPTAQTARPQQGRLYPGPARVIDLAQARAARSARKPRRPPATVSRGAMLAGLAGAAALGGLLMGLFNRDALTRYEDGKLFARGALDAALSAQLTGQAAAGSHILLTATYRTKNSNICRSFSIAATQILSGLACREHRQWRVQSLSSAGNLAVPSGNVRGADIAPLSNAAELQLRAHGWQPL